MTGFCLVTLQGNVGADPRASVTSTGESVSSLRVVYEVGYKENKKTVWMDVSVFGAKADICNKYIRKGALVTITGKLTMEEWKDKDGHTVSRPKVNADGVYFASSKMMPGWMMGGGGYGFGAPAPASQDMRFDNGQPQPPAQHAAPPPFNMSDPNAPETPPDGMAPQGELPQLY